MSEPEARSVKIIENGPLRVTGAPLHRLRPVNNDAGRPVDWQRGEDLETAESFSLCRCGASENKPFCDGTHNSIGFNGRETADRAPTASRREHYEGPGIVMTDDKTLCYHAGFCVREHAKAWSLVEQAEDAEARALLVDMIEKCPSGRLEYFEPPDETPVERTLEQQVGIVDDGPSGFREESRCRVRTAKPTRSATGARFAAAGRRTTNRSATVSTPRSVSRTASRTGARGSRGV